MLIQQMQIRGLPAGVIRTSFEVVDGKFTVVLTFTPDEHQVPGQTAVYTINNDTLQQ